jgi:hypothetical protein
MSETTEPPEGTPPAEPTPTPGTGPSGAPESTPPETDEPGPAREADETQQARGGEKRFAIITAKLSAAEKLYNAQQAELAHWRQIAAQQAPVEETPEQRMARIERDADTRAEARLLARRFHEEGQAQYPDWDQKTKDLMAMGADAGIATLLIEMPGGVRVAAALADDPAELQRIANIESERKRAIALGKYAATVDDAPPARAAVATPQVTRAPAPIRPVTGRASPQFNEYTATADQLGDFYMKQNLERQQRR